MSDEYNPWLAHLRQECDPDCPHCAEESQQILLEAFYGPDEHDELFTDHGGEG